ncbi:MAG: gliding motility-associated protein GldE [Bacteroidales bacterium]|nr:gliding motility-associated protein GldE [Bacteroidales bacterium]
MDPEPLLSFIFIFIKFNPVNAGIIWGIISAVILLFSSALVSGSEVAFFSLSPAQKNELSELDTKKSNLILFLLSKPEKLLATILIANNFINIGIVMISAYVLNNAFDFSNTPGWLIIFIQVGFITFLLLLFGEIIPKVYASKASLTFSKLTAYPLNLSMKIFSPISNLLIKSTSFVNKRLKMKKNISVEDLSDALELTEADIEQDKGILERIVTFGSIDVKEIMKPRVDVIVADINYSFNKLKSVIIESGFSRIPVYKENHDNIKGILLIKDLLEYIDIEDYKWQDVIKPPFFVPETMKINDLLEKFREKKIHIAIITDEYGGFLGIATMEDIIEEIVGEISDEKDDDEKYYKKIDLNTYIFEGKIPLNDFYKVLEIKEDIFEQTRGESDSLAGLILEKQGDIPKQGDIITIENYTFIIESSDNRKIKKIKLKIGD